MAVAEFHNITSSHLFFLSFLFKKKFLTYTQKWRETYNELHIPIFQDKQLYFASLLSSVSPKLSSFCLYILQQTPDIILFGNTYFT